MSNNKFINDLITFLDTYNFDGCFNSSFDVEKEGNTVKEEILTFTNIRAMLDYITENGKGWLSSDYPIKNTIGYINKDGIQVSINLLDLKRTKRHLKPIERACIKTAAGRRKLIKILRREREEILK